MKSFELGNRRYLGCKSKLIDFIHEVVKENCSDVSSILDVFGGTGVVGYSFNKECAVMVNDILKTNLVAYDTFFSSEPADTEKIEKIIEHYNCTKTIDENYYSLNFADTYLSRENMKKVGFIRDDIDDLYHDGKINSRERSILICSLVYAVDRIANTVGHYDAYRKNGNLDQELVMFMPHLDDGSYNEDNKIYNEDANELVRNVKADLVYIDPPYNSRQYCDAYHFLENVVTNKKPEVHGVARKMDRSGLKSRYCTSKAAHEFADLIENIDARYILVSYNDTGNKENPRSNAKISDSEIIDILQKKGEVRIFEKEYMQFNSGKTKSRDHKERLFLCAAGKSENHIDKEEDIIVQSPLNYTGGKYKILPQLMDKFPDDIENFYDIFSGGANVGANMNAQNIICIDINSRLISLLEYLKQEDYYSLIKHLDSLIEEYSLSNTYANGYDFYGCNSNNGAGKYNKEGFLRLRQAYNDSDEMRDDLFLLLIIYSFNNQIRFNNKGEFNLPVGKRDLNAKIRKKLQIFMDKLHNKNIQFINDDFRNIDIDTIDAAKSFFYLDPPYYLGTASYNENGGWTSQDETDLLGFLKKCDEKNIRFALSNVIEHKGKIHQQLLDWCLSNHFSINYIDKTYSNSNYHIKNKNQVTREVLITNY